MDDLTIVSETTMRLNPTTLRSAIYKTSLLTSRTPSNSVYTPSRHGLQTTQLAYDVREANGFSKTIRGNKIRGTGIQPGLIVHGRHGKLTVAKLSLYNS